MLEVNFSLLSVFDAFKCLCQASNRLECNLLNFTMQQQHSFSIVKDACVIIIYMATPHLAAIYMSLLNISSCLLRQSATESHTFVSATMSYNECYHVCSEKGTIYCALQGDRCICSDMYVRSSVDQKDSAA